MFEIRCVCNRARSIGGELLVLFEDGIAGNISATAEHERGQTDIALCVTRIAGFSELFVFTG